MRCLTRPRIIKVGIVEFGKESTARTRLQVEVLAGALAEMLCEQYGDMLDPDEVARGAGQVFQDTMDANPHAQPGYELPRDADRHPGAVRMARH